MAAANKLKIGFVFDDSLDKTDGIQQYILDLGTWLISQGHEVHYLVGETKRKDIPHVHSLARNMHVWSNGNHMSMPLPASRKAIKTLLDTEQFDVLHVQVPYSPLLAAHIILQAPSRTAIIGTFHIVGHPGIFELGTKLLAAWTRRSLRRFDQIISVSSAAAAYAKKTYGIDTEIVPNVIDYQRFATAQPFTQYEDDTKTILFFGRLVPRKGCLTLLEAVKRLRDDSDAPPFRVVICGKGPLLNNLQEYVASHGLKDTVDFTGFVSEEDKPRYYASSDISVFPSSGGESFGIVLLEAMASGKAAVLGGDNSGYHSVLEPKPWLLFDPYSPEKLAEKLEYLLSNESERLDYASWGKSYTKDFDRAVVGKKLLTIYERALRK